jgi:hypothetical protein
MNSHKDRMGEIAFWAIPRPGTDAHEKLAARMKATRTPEIEKELKKIFKQGVARIRVQQINGLGFPADKLLRYFNGEYNGRVINGTLHDLPSSFNVVEAFNRFVRRGALFELRDEVDHFFCFDDFIDYVTSTDEASLFDQFKELTDEGTIYTYNSIGDIYNLDFSTEGGTKFSFSSISLIRFGNEVSAILLAGAHCDLEAESAGLQAMLDVVHLKPSRKHIKPDPSLKYRAEPLFEGSDLWKTVVLVRFDIDTKTIDVRYVLQDYGATYNVISDDPSAYFSRGEKDAESSTVLKEGQERVKTYAALFELAKTCLNLPGYFSHREEDIILERHPTDFLKFKKKSENAETIALVKSKHCMSYRQAASLLRKEPSKQDVVEFYAPDLKIESSGYWKRLSPQAEGRDKKGQIIHGRTWVNQTLNWVENGPSTKVTVEKKNQNSTSMAEGGFIYIMRSPAHNRDIFKIGLTRRSAHIRAGELGGNTSSPDHFLVADEWPVSDCVRAEKLIHMRLAAYRINPNREFFQLPYSKAVSIIAEVIKNMVSSPKIG